MIPRKQKRVVKNRLRQFPAVVILGPRQCGKTTMAKMMGGVYFDLEDPADRQKLDIQWDQIINGKALVILDEAQCCPEVFSRLRSVIDADRKRNGRFLLLGSVSPALTTQISESLAGRLAVVELSPLILPELKESQMDRLWFYGGYPDGGVLDQKIYPQWQESYIQTLTMRDLPQWGWPAKPQTTKQLLSMLAVVHAQLWNASRIASSMGLSFQTINNYMAFLDGTFLFRRLLPFHSNIRKRMVKSPKMYIRDSGLLHSLMEVRDFDHLMTQPWIGASWEGFVIEQTLCTLTALDRRCSSYYLRTSDQQELDLILDFAGEVWAIEIKLASNPSMDDLDKLKKTASLINASRRILICRTAKPIDGGQTMITNLPMWLKSLSL
jgi:uncharacterized protein